MKNADNIDEIENCFKLLNTEDAESANETINEWLFNADTVLADIALILSRSSDHHVRLRTAYILLHYLDAHWSMHDQEQHIQLRTLFLESVFNAADSSDIRDVLSECIAKIAVYDILDEWDTFFTDCCFFDESFDLDSRRQRLTNMYKFFQEADTTMRVTPVTKQRLKDICMEQTGDALNCARIGLTDEATIVPALYCMNSLFEWCQLQEVMPAELLNQICFVFLGAKQTQKAALECLRTVFMKRTDSNAFFKQYAPLLIHSLATVEDPTNSALPVTKNPDVFDFLMSFLVKFMNLIDILFFPPSTAVGFDPEKLQEDERQMLEGLTSFNVSKEDIAGELLTLLRIILSADIENVNDTFWKLWSDICRKIYNEQINTPESRPMFEFFGDILNILKENLYERLPAAADGEGDISFDAKSCWSILFQIDSGQMVEFITQRDLSMEQCYAIGCIEWAFASDEFTFPVYGLIPDIIRTVREDPTVPSDVIIAIFFAISHSTAYFQSNRNDLTEAISFIIDTSQQYDESVGRAASNTLLIITHKLSDALLDNQMELAEEIIDYSWIFLERSDGEVIINLFKVSSQLISRCTDAGVVEEKFKALFLPCLEPIQNFGANPEDQELMSKCINALDAISECAVSVSSHGEIISSLFLDVLIELGGVVFGEPQLYDVSSSLLIAIASLLTWVSWEQVKGPFETICGGLEGKEEGVSSIFTFIKIIRTKFAELDEEFPLIFETFISAAMQQNPVPVEPLLYMAKEFPLSVIPTEWLLEVFTIAMSDYRREANEAAIVCWKAIIKKDKESAADFFKETLESVMRSAFQDIISLTHGASYDLLVDFVRFLFSNAKDYEIIDTEEFSAMLVGILGELCHEEPREGFFAEFVEYLKSIYLSFSMFVRAISDFLTSLNKVSAVDADIFKVNDSLRFRTPRNTRVIGNRALSQSDIYIPSLCVKAVKRLMRR